MSSPSPTSDPVVLTLERTVDAPRLARDQVRAAAGRLPRAEDAVLLVSELVTNAVKYGGEGPVELRLAPDDDHVRISVRDHGGRGVLPVMRESGDGEGGHGLRLVDALSDRWGVERGSTIVWFELELR
jgi:anti-sigma regulatory factor (Ser/Thr protein kinase)